MKYEDREKHILQAAVRVAERIGYFRITRVLTAKEADVSEGLVQNHFRNQTILQEAVLDEAIRTENLQIVGQAAILRDNLVTIPSELVIRAVKFITEGTT